MTAPNFLLYTAADGNIAIEATIKDESLWLTQKAMAELFGVQVPAIAKHLKNIFESGELEQISVISKMETTAQDGKTYNVLFYNLDAIISVGYRVNSSKATHFRIWATQVLKEYIIKGFAMDDERLKQGKATFNKDYFKELLERVRSIRSSERRIWLQITDIFAECSTDYNKNSPQTKEFFASVQNKFHYAITGQTAPEIIASHADSRQAHMGLTTWKNAPDGRILQSDVTIAKNYLNDKEIRKLERSVSGFFDYVEDLIEEEHAFTMDDFSTSINAFLEFRHYKILEHKGSISKNQADQRAIEQYKEYNKQQAIESDFDKLLKQIQNPTD